MPSGYTSDIYEGDENLKKYVTKVARSMTDFIHMRDERMDAPLTRRSWSSFDADYLRQADAALNEFLEMNDDERHDLYEHETAEAAERIEASNKRAAELDARYARMIERVKNLDWPSEIAYAKDYAIKYLEESRDFDVYTQEPYVKPTFDDWLAKKTQHLSDTYTRAVKRDIEAKQRDTEFNAKIEVWLDFIEGLDE